MEYVFAVAIFVLWLGAAAIALSVTLGAGLWVWLDGLAGRINLWRAERKLEQKWAPVSYYIPVSEEQGRLWDESADLFAKVEGALDEAEDRRRRGNE